MNPYFLVAAEIGRTANAPTLAEELTGNRVKNKLAVAPLLFASRVADCDDPEYRLAYRYATNNWDELEEAFSNV